MPDWLLSMTLPPANTELVWVFSMPKTPFMTTLVWEVMLPAWCILSAWMPKVWLLILPVFCSFDAVISKLPAAAMVAAFCTVFVLFSSPVKLIRFWFLLSVASKIPWWLFNCLALMVKSPAWIKPWWLLMSFVSVKLWWRLVNSLPSLLSSCLAVVVSVFAWMMPWWLSMTFLTFKVWSPVDNILPWALFTSAAVMSRIAPVCLIWPWWLLSVLVWILKFWALVVILPWRLSRPFFNVKLKSSWLLWLILPWWLFSFSVWMLILLADSIPWVLLSKSGVIMFSTSVATTFACCVLVVLLLSSVIFLAWLWLSVSVNTLPPSCRWLVATCTPELLNSLVAWMVKFAGVVSKAPSAFIPAITLPVLLMVSLKISTSPALAITPVLLLTKCFEAASVVFAA